MILLIETFQFPAVDIAKQLYPRKQLLPLKINTFSDLLILKNEDSIFYIQDNHAHKEEIKYYFSEIAEIKNGILIRMNKSRRKKFFYEIKNRKIFLIRNEQIVQEIDRTGLLPHKDREEEEIILFPSDEE